MFLISRFLFLGSLCELAFAVAVNTTNSASPATTGFSTCGVTTQIALDHYRGYSTDPALQCSCASDLQNWLQASAGPVRTVTRLWGVGVTTVTTTTNGAIETKTSAVISTGIGTITGNYEAAGNDVWYGTATAPCCSSCVVGAQSVNLLYWPTPAVPSQPTSFVSDGFTFISPSVYIGFTSLSAYDYCGTVGNIYSSTTIAFDPSELSSITTFTPSLTTTQTLTWSNYLGDVYVTTETDIVSAPGDGVLIDYRDLSQNCSANIQGYYYAEGNPSNLNGRTYDPCHPTIVLPNRVRTLDPAWASCIPNIIGGFYDPPYALTQAGGLIPTSSPAAPSSAVPPPIATSTSPPPLETESVGPTETGLPPAPTTSSPLPPSDPDQPPTSVPTEPTSPVDPGDPGNSPTSAQPPPPTTSSPNEPPPASPSNSSPDHSPPPTSSVDDQSPPASSSPGSPEQPHPGNSSPGIPDQPPAVTTSPGGTAEPPAPTSPDVVIGSQTLIPGGPAVTSAGTTYSLAPGGSQVVNGITQTPVPATTPGAFIIGGSSISANSASQFVIGSQTLAPGGSAVTVDGTTFSLPATGSVIVVNGVTLSASTAAPASSPSGGLGSGPGSGGLVTVNGTLSAGNGSALPTLHPTSNTGVKSLMRLEIIWATFAIIIGGLAVWL